MSESNITAYITYSLKQLTKNKWSIYYRLGRGYKKSGKSKRKDRIIEAQNKSEANRTAKC